jgi:hypothetical protein
MDPQLFCAALRGFVAAKLKGMLRGRALEFASALVSGHHPQRTACQRPKVLVPCFAQGSEAALSVRT